MLEFIFLIVIIIFIVIGVSYLISQTTSKMRESNLDNNSNMEFHEVEGLLNDNENQMNGNLRNQNSVNQTEIDRINNFII